MSEAIESQWAWWDAEKERFRWVWPSKIQVQMCFPDGGKRLTEQGKGEIVKVEIRRKR